MCPSRFDLVNTIETKPLCAYSSTLADIFIMTKGRTLLILKVKVTIDIYGEHYRDLTAVCFFIKLCIYISHSERMDSINLQKVKVTIDIYGNKLVNTIDLTVGSLFIKFADMLAIVRGWSLLILEVKGQRHNGRI